MIFLRWSSTQRTEAGDQSNRVAGDALRAVFFYCAFFVIDSCFGWLVRGCLDLVIWFGRVSILERSQPIASLLERCWTHDGTGTLAWIGEQAEFGGAPQKWRTQRGCEGQCHSGQNKRNAGKGGSVACLLGWLLVWWAFALLRFNVMTHRRQCNLLHESIQTLCWLSN